jgi:hypothetical protein
MFTNIRVGPALSLAFRKPINCKEVNMLDKVLDKLLWSGHSSFIYEGDKLIYFDPFALHRLRRADITLVGHDHPRHCSPVDIDKVRRAPTVILAGE